MSYAFGSASMNAPLTPKERIVQLLTNPKSRVKGKKTDVEASVNTILGMSHILNDDEYNMMKKGAY